MLIIKKRPMLILFFAILFTSMLLRSNLVVIGPISDIVINDLKISATSFGLITTIPLIVFALSSAMIPFIASRRGLINSLIIGLILIIIGSLLRSVSNYYILLLGTFFLGFGISMGNVLIPAIIKDNAQEYRAIFTSFYLCMQNLLASLASGIAIYITLQFSWSFLMAIWIIPAGIALILWLRYKSVSLEDTKNNKTELSVFNWNTVKQLLISPYAWGISLLMGLQSVMYYTNVAWLPTIATDNNFSQEFVSFLMIAFQLIPLPGLFFVPILFKKVKQDSYIVLLASACMLIGTLSLMLTHNIVMFFIAVMFLSLGAGSCFAWVVATITNKTKDGQQASSLSAMSQTIGYSMAAVGPWLGGMLVDVTGSPQTILIFILLIGVIVTIISVYVYLRRNTLSFD